MRGVGPGSPRAPAARPDVSKRGGALESAVTAATAGRVPFHLSRPCLTALPFAVLRLPPLLAASIRHNSNRASISHLHRQRYGRLYPVLLVNTDGSTVRLRYGEPKGILTLPLDSSTLPEAERRARLRRHFPSRPRAAPEETFEGIDLDTYRRFWKK
ncbi:large ribosomal subunit protein mL55 [Pterocles gutturalis]